MTDPKMLWREQSAETLEMRLESLRADVRAERCRIRRARGLLVLCTLVGMALTAHQAVLATHMLVRFGEGLMTAGFGLVLLLGWHRLARASPDQAETCVAYLRESLLQRRDAARGGWIVLIAPLLPGLWATFIGLAEASGRHWERMLPIVALLVAWLVVALALQAREAAKVSVEIARLDALNGGL